MESPVITYLLPLTGLVMFTLGGVLLMEIKRDVVEVWPALSFTVSVTIYGVGTPDGALKVCEGFAAVLFAVPSPKSQLYVSASPSGSVEPLPVNCTAKGPGP